MSEKWFVWRKSARCLYNSLIFRIHIITCGWAKLFPVYRQHAVLTRLRSSLFLSSRARRVSGKLDKNEIFHSITERMCLPRFSQLRWCLAHGKRVGEKRKQTENDFLSSIDDKTKRKTAFKIKINITESLLMALTFPSKRLHSGVTAQVINFYGNSSGISRDSSLNESCR